MKRSIKRSIKMNQGIARKCFFMFIAVCALLIMGRVNVYAQDGRLNEKN